MESFFMNRNLRVLVATAITISFISGTSDGADGLIGHWKLTADARDSSGTGRHAVNHRVRFDGDGGAVFNGVDAWLEVPQSNSISFGRDPFSISVWIHTDKRLDDVLGDVLTCYDAADRGDSRSA